MAEGGNKGGGEQRPEGSARRDLLAVNVVLLALVLVSAFAAIRSTHTCRDLYTQLQVLESSQWYLQEDYGRLLLEQSTQASHYRVEKVARDDLGMTAPNLERFKVVQQ